MTSVYLLSTVANQPIGTFWPVVSHPAPNSYTRTVVGRDVEEGGHPRHFLMFTSTRLGEEFEFNHFVPLVERKVRASFLIINKRDDYISFTSLASIVTNSFKNRVGVMSCQITVRLIDGTTDGIMK